MSSNLREDVKEAWTSALRSGEYQQGVAKLRHNNHHCCLGVLCDVIVKQFPELIPAGITIDTVGSNDIRITDYLDENDEENEYILALSPGLSAALGFDGNTDVELPNGTLLTTLNDTGSSFTDIADIIDEEL